MATVAHNVDVHQEVCLFTLNVDGSGVNYEFAALIDTISRSGGEKDIEGVPVVNGGRVTKTVPETDYEISLEAYELDVDSTLGENGGFASFFHGSATTNETFNNSKTRLMFRATFLITEESVSTATAAISANKECFRWSLADCRITMREMNPFTPTDPMKYSITLKAPAYDRSANSNVLEESQDSGGGNGFVVFTDYDSTNADKFRG